MNPKQKYSRTFVQVTSVTVFRDQELQEETVHWAGGKCLCWSGRQYRGAWGVHTRRPSRQHLEAAAGACSVS